MEEKKKTLKKMKVCEAYDCNMDSSINRISMFLFPKDLKRKKIWIQRLNMGRTATTNIIPKSHSKFCFKHFDDNQFLISPKLAEAVGYKNFRFRLTLSQTTNFRLFQIQRVCRRQFQM